MSWRSAYFTLYADDPCTDTYGHLLSRVAYRMTWSWQPRASIQIESSSWFLDQSIKWGKAMIPVFNSNNKGNVLVQAVDTATSTSALFDFQLVELNAPNDWSPMGGGY